MEISTNLGFYLPSSASDDIADINQISDNFRNLDEYIPGMFREVKADIRTKQDVLVSGKNIKSVNGKSLLGEGNLELSIEVDQTYNPTSENAQSGKAVAEAVGSVEDAIDEIIELQELYIYGENLIKRPYPIEAGSPLPDGVSASVSNNGVITINVDGIVTDATGNILIGVVTNLNAGSYKLAYPKSIITDDDYTDTGMWAHEIIVSNPSTNETLSTVELERKTVTNENRYISFDIQESGTIAVTYNYRSAGVAMANVAKSVQVVIKPKLYKV